jgi:hypothetical protein
MPGVRVVAAVLIVTFASTGVGVPALAAGEGVGNGEGLGAAEGVGAGNGEVLAMEQTEPAMSTSTSVIERSYHTRERVNRLGMWTLGGWALANFLFGGVLYFTDPGRQAFHEMNVFWNTVNAGLATSALISSYRGSAPASLAAEIRAQHRLEKTLLVNAGLDVGYIMTGFFLRQYAANVGEPRFAGWGSSLILQGGFLLVFDIVLAAIHSRNRAYEDAFTAE